MNQRSFQKNTMTKDYFRLNHINARRLPSVDGHDTVPINASPPGVNASPPGGRGVQIIRGRTEASRAIHGYHHEPRTNWHADYSIRLLHHFIMFREVNHRPHRPHPERLHRRRISRRVGYRDSRSEHARGRPDNEGDSRLEGLAKPDPEPGCCLEL